MDQYQTMLSKQVNESKASASKWEFPLEKRNLYYILAAIALIIVGYLCMYTGVTEEPAVVDGTWNNSLAVNVAPIILIIGYCVVLPYGLLKRFNKPTENKEN